MLRKNLLKGIKMIIKMNIVIKLVSVPKRIMVIMK